MNSLGTTFPVNGNTRISLESERGSEAPLRCGQCGYDADSSKSSPNPNAIEKYSVTNEFQTIRLEDIFTNFSPQGLLHESPSSDNNNESQPNSATLCSNCRCSLVNPLAQQSKMVSSSSIQDQLPTNSFLNGSICKLNEAEEVFGGHQSASPGVCSDAFKSPLPISIVLPNLNDTPFQVPAILAINEIKAAEAANENGHTVSYSCTLCSKNFKNERLVAAHRDKHHSKLARYSCDTCQGKFCYRGALNAHISSQHPQQPSYDCTTCGKTFKERSNLSAHNTIVHALNPRVFKCEFCVSAFSKKVNLNYHRKRKHSQAAPSDTCAMEAKNNGNGIHAYAPPTAPCHIVVKSEPLDFLPEESLGDGHDGRATTPAGLPVTGQNVPSQGSEGTLRQPSEEKGATPTGPNARAEGDFKCQFCGRGFLFRNNLKCHLRTHIRDKKYTCSICEKSFIYKESLKNHMLLHSNELPYQCDICMKKFRDRSNRRKHVKNVHKFLIAGNTAPGLGATENCEGGSRAANPKTGALSEPKRRKRAPAKKKAPFQPSSPSPPRGGVIVSPPKPPSPVYPNTGNVAGVKSETLSPPRQETYPDAAHMHQHYQLSAPMTHPNVIVYSKVKVEPEGTYSESRSEQGSETQPLINPVTQRQQYYESYEQHQGQGMETYGGHLTSPQSISPERTASYDSPVSPYGLNMSILPSERHRNNVTSHHAATHISLQEYSHPHSPALLYSSPLMSMGDGGSGYHPYWIPPSQAADQNEAPRPYYAPVPIPTVTEGSLLNPQTTYANAAQQPPSTQPSQGPPQQHNYFYTDLAQFDLSHL